MFESKNIKIDLLNKEWNSIFAQRARLKYTYQRRVDEKQVIQPNGDSI